MSDSSKEPCRIAPGAPPESDAACSPDGVDLTLIRWTPSLTPDERLDLLQSAVRSLHDLRGLPARR